MLMMAALRLPVQPLPSLFSLLLLLSLLSLPLSTVAGSADNNCTDASSASWTVSNFTANTDTKFVYGLGTVGLVSFYIQNTANGVGLQCLQGESPATGREPNHYAINGEVWYSCDVFCKGAAGTENATDPPLATAFHFNIQTKTLKISQTFGCAGGNSSQAWTNFTAAGATVVDDLSCSQIAGRRPDQVVCAPVDSFAVDADNVTVAAPGLDAATWDGSSGATYDPYLDHGGQPVNPYLPVLQPLPGVQPSTPGCSKASRSSGFLVSDVSYISALGPVSFSLTNSALNYTQRCILGQFTIVDSYHRPMPEDMPTPTWWNCTLFDSLHVNYPANQIFTSVLFGGPQNVLGINQTWYCDDEDASQPTVYTAYGEASFPLQCNETRYCVPASEYDHDLRPSKTILDMCGANPMTITPTRLHSYHVSPQQALDTFRPRGYNCSDKSLEPAGKQVWDISAFSYNHTWTTASYSLYNGAPMPPSSPSSSSSPAYQYFDFVRFYYNNTATDNVWPRNTGWRECRFFSDESLPTVDGVQWLTCLTQGEPIRLLFRFNNATDELSIQQSWSCDGNDTDHQNEFVAAGTTKVPLNCQTQGNNTVCLSPQPIRIPISNITATLNTEIPRRRVE